MNLRGFPGFRRDGHDWDWIEVRTGFRGRMATILGLRLIAHRLAARAWERQQAADAAQQEDIISRLVSTGPGERKVN